MARTDGQRPRQVEGGSRPAKAAARYDRRGKAVSLKQVGDKKLKAQLRKAEYVNTKTAERAAAAEAMLAPHESGALEAEGAMERTFKFKHSGREWTGIPLIVANMDTVGTFEMGVEMARHKAQACTCTACVLHVHCTTCAPRARR